MTAKKAVQMIREKIEVMVRDERSAADECHKARDYESEQSHRSYVAVLSGALCCVGDVEKELHR